MQKLVLCAALAATLVGCAHGQRAYADPAAAMAPEAATMWSRPQEMGYTLGERLTGEASIQCVLGFICWGADDGGASGALAGLVGMFTGSAAPADPLVRAAAASAVLSAPSETDGIYVLNHETDSFNIYIFSRRAARVTGKAVRLKPMGEVSQERADKERFLKAASGALHLNAAFGDIH
jgi:hypothetical protein